MENHAHRYHAKKAQCSYVIATGDATHAYKFKCKKVAMWNVMRSHMLTVVRSQGACCFKLISCMQFKIYLKLKETLKKSAEIVQTSA